MEAITFWTFVGFFPAEDECVNGRTGWVVAQARSPGSCCHNLRGSRSTGLGVPCFLWLSLRTGDMPVSHQLLWAVSSHLLHLPQCCPLRGIHRQCAIIPDGNCEWFTLTDTALHTDSLATWACLPSFPHIPVVFNPWSGSLSSHIPLRHAGNPLPSWFILI